MPSAKVKALGLLLVLFGLGQHVQLGSTQAAGLVDRLVLNAATSALQEAFELMKHKKPTEMWDEFIQFVFPTGPDNTRVLPYDGVVDVNSVAAVLNGKGWDVIFEEGYHNYLQRIGHKKAVRTCFKGRFNTGKTFVLGMFAGSPPPNGYTLHTPGLSVKYVNTTSGLDLLFIDTAGTDVPVLNELQLLDRRLTDAFLQELIFSLCDTDIFVVNQVTLADQIFLTALQKRLQRDYPHQKVKDRLLLLHNLKDIEEVADVQKVVEEDIKGAFNATEGDNEGTYYTSQHFYHFIVARQGTAAGQHYNQRTINFLNNLLAGKMDRKEVSSLLPDLMQHAERLLKTKYLVKVPSKEEVATQQKQSSNTQANKEGLLKQVANYLGVKYLFDLAAQPSAGAGAESAPPTREEVDINGRVNFELTFHEASGAVRDEGSGRTTNYIPSIRPKTEVGTEISISPFLQFKEDGFVDFMFNGLFTQPMTVGQKDGKVTITVDVPGVEKVHWQTLGNQVFIRGCRGVQNDFDRMLREERFAGCFQKHLEVPQFFIDRAQSVATHEHGVFTLTLTKEEPFL